MGTKEIRKALNGYYNLCMDEFDGHVREEGIDMFMEREYPWEKPFRRKGEMISKHPHIKDMAMQDPLVKDWIESWAKTELTIEEGLAQLSVLQQKSRKDLEKHLKNHRVW